MKGPKFCPVKKGRNSDFYGGIKMFSKKLVLQEKYFDASFTDKSLIRPQSKKYATTNNKDLSDIISTISKITPSIKTTPDNLNYEERKALEEIKKLCETSIIIKKADKSNTLVIMERNDYENKLVLADHLHTSTYERADDGANQEVHKKLIKLCEKHNTCITGNEKKAILKEDWSESQFYVLPKIHKSQNILAHISQQNKDYVHIPFPDDLKGRPINGDVNSVTQGLSKLLDKILNPLVTQLRTFIKDEFDFLRKFPKKIPPETKIVRCDVTSLYTSIPTHLGIEALDYWLTKLLSMVDSRFTKAFVLESVSFILENNFFEFNRTMWHQLCGTAMGKSFAPPYACLTMGYLEETILIPKLIPRNFDSETSKMIIDYLMRYIDDGIMVLPECVTVEEFLRIMNSMNASIQHTVSLPEPLRIEGHDFKCTKFLAIKVLQQPDGSIKFDVYYKETNAHDYLAFDSHHPLHTKSNIPYTLAKRIVVISSEDSWMERNLQDLKQFLLDRKYPEDVIEKGIHNAKLQGPAPPLSTSQIVPLITPFLGNLDSANIINTTRDLLASSSNERIHRAFDQAKLVQCYTQPSNLLQLVSTSRFVSDNGGPRNARGVFRCKSNKCEICAFGYLQECQKFVVSNGSTWVVKCKITCNSLNVIYFLKCNYCQTETKLGKTDNLRDRTNNHRSGCRKGTGADLFDKHVYSCRLAKRVPPKEPEFLMFCLMSCSDFNKLLSYERDMHLKGFDTLFKLR